MNKEKPTQAIGKLSRNKNARFITILTAYYNAVADLEAQVNSKITDVLAHYSGGELNLFGHVYTPEDFISILKKFFSVPLYTPSASNRTPPTQDMKIRMKKVIRWLQKLAWVKMPEQPKEVTEWLEAMD